MARQVREDDLAALEAAIARHPEGLTVQEIAAALPEAPPRRTLQYRLRKLVDSGRLVREGGGRSARYRLAGGPAAGIGEPPAPARAPEVAAGEAPLELSPAGAEIRAHIRGPLQGRRPVGYDRPFLEGYRPNESFYLTPAERDRLREVGTPAVADQPAGTYARQILNRLLIDLSWNSSRLEGNTYSLIDTKRLVAFGTEAAGRDRREAQMILNHKDAIEFLVEGEGEIGFNRHTVLNLHALLASNLLDDPAAEGRLRRIPVGIEGSVYLPLEVPQLIEECFGQLLATAAVIRDPFEQAFFVMVQLPYLQPFDDVNKRVSRLAANIPLIRANLSPLSFDDVPREAYTEAVLGVYELRRTELLRDLFLWAYERSAVRYAAVRQSLGEPDPFRLSHREALREVIGDIVRRSLGRGEASRHLAAWAEANIEAVDRDRFQEVAEDELLALHEGNFARYRLRPAEFHDWQQCWRRPR